MITIIIVFNINNNNFIKRYVFINRLNFFFLIFILIFEIDVDLCFFYVLSYNDKDIIFIYYIYRRNYFYVI